MGSRRKFLEGLTRSAGSLAFLTLANPSFAEEAYLKMEKYGSASHADEDFWGWIRESYTMSPNIINFNNGGVAPQPKVVQDAMIRYYQYCNEAPSYYMWQILDQGREPLRLKLAELCGCSPEEIAINRNSTEGLNTVIFGLNLKAGDEIVLTKQDYPNMINAWKQREKRDGIKLVWLDLPLPMYNDDDIVRMYTSAFTSKTKVVHVTHLINWTGQILPVKRIAQVAHKQGIEVIADGAHSLAHFEFNVPDLDCDYFASSLHKWLSAPFGSGLLYIRKFESLGTRSFASEMAIGTSVDFHNIIGSKRKEERLRYLKNYWVNQVKGLPGVSFNQPDTLTQSCAIASIAIKNKKPEDISGELFTKYKIHTVAINWENIHGVRVAPNVYTNTRELDKLVTAIKAMTGKG